MDALDKALEEITGEEQSTQSTQSTGPNSDMKDLYNKVKSRVKI